ncbi:MAG: ABC transporter permease subunit [Deltaproteobacteria bacterium]|nr:ABC transporter permease subunit [Deltaproteobacteria bacterium]
MAAKHSSPEFSLSALWRNENIRAVLYQILVLLLFIAGGVIIFRNTFANLETRGISSGFKFLNNEAGFLISEALPVPLLEGPLLLFLAAVGAGLLGVVVLKRYQTRRGERIGDRSPLVWLSFLLVLGLPGAVLFFWGHDLRMEAYSESSPYRMALLVGLLNTLKVSFIGCLLATFLGLIIGLGRLSSNWLVSQLAGAYVEVIRNIPLLLQLYFWYQAVLQAMPDVQDSVALGNVFIMNNRGVYVPNPTAGEGFRLLMLSLVIAGLGIYARARSVRRIQEATGIRGSVMGPSLAMLIGFPALAVALGGQPFAVTYPELEGFNFIGGLVLTPEYAALLLGLVIYTAAFIAEIVRSGIQAVSKGQREAAQAMGLRKGLVMRLVILPQALRVIIPPLTSQYLNLTKNSSLGIAIGYPELVSVGGTTLNQSGQAIEIIAITMAVYLTFSLLISLFMNWYNAKIKLVER